MGIIGFLLTGGYRGVDVDGVTIWRSGQKRGVTRTIRKAIHRRSAVEPMIGHMKNEGKLRRNWPKGTLGDALNAVLCGAGHNLRLILRAIWLFYAWILWAWVAEHGELAGKNAGHQRLVAA